MTTFERQEYIRLHTKKIAGAQYNIHRTTHDLLVFKKVHVGRPGKSQHAVANLIIPAGSVVRLPAYYDSKCRADKAFVHSIIRRSDFKEFDQAFAEHFNSFKYHKGQMAVPVYKFDMENEECASGIHFFLDIESAYKY